MGLALDPEFETQPFVYLYFTTADGLQLERWRFEDDRLTREASLIDGVIEAGPVHDSGRIAFGPDRALYVATGDAGNGELAQAAGLAERQVPAADRLPRRTGAAGDPLARPPQPAGVRLAARHRAAVLDRARAERRRRRRRASTRSTRSRRAPTTAGRRSTAPTTASFTAPLKVYEEAIAPSGATFWNGEFVFATLRGEALRRLDLDSGEDEVLLEGEYGRLRTVRVGPDGALYVLTSNRDGRGSPEDSDDRVLRVTAP